MENRMLTKSTLAGFVMVSMVFTGCQFGPTTTVEDVTNNQVTTTQSPEEIVKAMQATWGDDRTQIGSLDGSVDLAITAEGTSADLMVTMGGTYDISDLSTPQLDMTFAVQGEASENGASLGSGEVELSVRVLATAMYANLMKFDIVSDEAEAAQIAAMASGFVGTWYELPADVLQEFQVAMAEALSADGEDAELQNKVMEVAQNADLFKITQDLGMMDGKHRFAYEVDRDGFKQFMIDVAAATGQPAPTASDLADFDAGLDQVAISGELWINASDMRLDTMQIRVVGNADGADVDVTLTLSYGQLASFSATAPTDAQPLPF